VSAAVIAGNQAVDINAWPMGPDTQCAERPSGDQISHRMMTIAINPPANISAEVRRSRTL